MRKSYNHEFKAKKKLIHFEIMYLKTSIKEQGVRKEAFSLSKSLFRFIQFVINMVNDQISDYSFLISNKASSRIRAFLIISDSAVRSSMAV